MLFTKDTLIDVFAQQRSALILWIPVCLGIGSAIYFSLAGEPPFSLTLSLFGLAAIVLGCVARLCFRAEDPNRHYVLLILTSAVFWSVAGFSAAQIQAISVTTPMLASDNRIGQVEGRIVHHELLDGKRGALVILDDVKVDDWPEAATPRRVRLTARVGAETLHLGDRISVLAKLHAASPPVTPGAYDFQRFYYFQGIGALGFTLKPPKVLAASPEDDPAFFLQHLRQRIAGTVNQVLGPRVAGIAVALMTGDRAAIGEEDWTALRNSGLAHIISISGLHVALMAAPVFFFVRLILAAIPFIALRWPIKKIAACAALISVCAYVALVVPSVPTYRSLMMTGIGLIAIMLDRSPFSMRLVAFAAIVVLLFSPDSIWSASLQMSFAAVTALVAVADLMRPVWSSYIRNGGIGRKIVVYVAGAILTTCVASIATSPFSSYHFQQISSYSVLANGLAIPLTGLLIMPMIVLSFVLLPFGLAQQPLELLGKGIEWMLDVAAGVAALPGSVIHTPAWPQSALIMMVLGGLCLTLLAGRVRWIASAPLFVVAVLLIGLAREPVVMVAASGKLVMVNADDRASISSGRAEKFALETWQKRIDVDSEQVVTWPKEGSAAAGDAHVACDREVCRITLPDVKISTGQSLYALREDCAWADVIIVPAKKMKPCAGGRKNVAVYDRWRFMKTGALAIMADGEIRAVREEQGDRPWSTWLNDKRPKMED